MLKHLKKPLTGRPTVVFGLAVIAVLLCILWGRQRRDQAVAALETLQQRIRFSQSGPITPGEAALKALQQANARLTERNEELKTRLFPQADGRLGAPFSGNSTAAYFELAGFVETMSQKFKDMGIALPEKNRFSFSQFEQQGPATEILPAVMKQKTLAGLLLDELQKARPVALLGIKREFIEEKSTPRPLLGQAGENRASTRIQYTDTIVRGEKPMGFESYSFELEFEGYTESLRRFLKAVLNAPRPVVVSGLEVQPLNRFAPDEGTAAPAPANNPFEVLSAAAGPEVEAGPVPIIRNNLSAFTLRLEVYWGEEASTGG